jgi:uncharacterized protein YcfJ
MVRPAKRTWAVLLLLGIAAITVSSVAVLGVFSGQRSQARSPQVTPVPDVIGMTKDRAVRILEAAHLRPVIKLTRHAKGQQSGIVVAAFLGSHPINVGGSHSVGVATEGDAIPLILSR